MKKILSILIILFVASYANATTYYGGAADKNINGDDLWYTGVTGSCAGDGSPVAWSTVGQTGNTLVANGCTITIPNDANLTVTVDKISNKETDTPDADCVDGGSFTYETSADYTLTLNAAIEAGRTEDCLVISGSAPGSARVTLTGAMNGGSASGVDSVYDTHTVGEVVVGSTGNLVTITGGSNVLAFGYKFTANAASTVKMYANGVGGSSAGIQNSSVNSGAIITIYEGVCLGGASASGYGGCSAPNAGPIVLSGVTIQSGTGTFGVSGRIYAQPGATNYILMPVDSSYSAGTVDTHSVVYGPVADGDSWTNSNTLTTEAEIKSGEKIGTATGTMSISGGGAWGW